MLWHVERGRTSARGLSENGAERACSPDPTAASRESQEITVPDVVDDYRRATDAFGRRVALITGEQWGGSTPCTEWSVRDLVAHVLYEQLWIPPLVNGYTIFDVGDRLDGDQLGGDALGAWRRAQADVVKTIAIDGALERIVNLSSGARSAADYLAEVTVDTLIHTWDLARAIGDDERLDDRLVRETLVAKCAEDEADFRLGGDDQSTLLSLFGRTP
ncbi:MAG: TIGR03086 family protein [Actinobacteria bacterium]|nr:TIGR03086 family protein [Actinomycetota bacterium]